MVLEDNGAVIADAARIREIERGLWRVLQQREDSPPTVTRRAPRQVRMFSTPTQVNFSVDSRNDRTILELIAADRPGLLSEVGKVFRAERVAINGAKIMTVGERAEDVFYITGADGGLLEEEVMPARAGSRWCGRWIDATWHAKLVTQAPSANPFSGLTSIIDDAYESRAQLDAANHTRGRARGGRGGNRSAGRRQAARGAARRQRLARQ